MGERSIEYFPFNSLLKIDLNSFASRLAVLASKGGPNSPNNEEPKKSFHCLFFHFSKLERPKVDANIGEC